MKRQQVIEARKFLEAGFAWRIVANHFPVSVTVLRHCIELHEDTLRCQQEQQPRPTPKPTQNIHENIPKPAPAVCPQPVKRLVSEIDQMRANTLAEMRRYDDARARRFNDA